MKKLDLLASNKSTLIVALGLLIPLLGACENPADGKPMAMVASAQQIVSGTAATGSDKLAITADRSKVEWVGSKVTGKHEGGFKQLTGSVELADGKIEGGKVRVDIDMKSLWSDAEKLTGHLMSKDFFEVEKYPTSTFVSTEVKAGGVGGGTHTVTGNLTLHGQTKSITFPATIKITPDRLTVQSEFAINRKDFGIVYAGKPDDLIRDEVVIKLDLQVPRS